MTAKHSDLGRIQEIYDVVTQTQRQMCELELSKVRFLEPANTEDDLIAEGLINRVLRVAEEAGRIGDDTAQRYGFDTKGASGVRNRLTHAYGEIDRDIIWQVISEDFDELIRSCHAFCDDEGLELS
ncbi:HepT-like ribonuclease domain-containing protein [Collinsella intestinalis]|uniref:HepT-like ribonuclease domain-containing protein n=1 Tax=Collinsella intestinalis TaxID=147207 RepID=UPI0025A3274E|nr:HepT-like ribonuclease domain-containing protein [Collinsella intestinalis]MDM8163445.1 DUF86 domain-containing protein [Collinsella intestinalis]